ncbi:65-kDa microtubule-associated protein 1 [Selaginella moellendorffii]|uniref:65-kDa microtubule-associated protein 1 n=1 Tax=Selaginella moellendorffii TaxID=88036 RepID=UPI000D1CF2FF|nr:65-kDa microtubule-associated protein 1 [Selaginella moellendorffii]|eukprot:XP_024536274.1 65-kDa microtubule-associated protein 1 [Selaginella moellendorffii]
MDAASETTCGSLLRELQHIWDEVGESDEERDRMLLQLEQECLEVYRRKVDQANHGRARLHRALADAEAELAALVSTLGERPIIIENRLGTLKEQFAAVYPIVEEMKQKKEERSRQIADVRFQIQKIRGDIAGAPINDTPVEEDLTLRKLEEYQLQLQALQKEKCDRMNKVMEYVNLIHDLCSVLAIDFLKTVGEVHPSLESLESTHTRSISNETLAKLQNTAQRLQQEKKERMIKLQELGEALIELWSLMDTPSEEQNCFQHITCHLAARDDEVTTPGALSLDVMEQADLEVQRLSHLKISKMKELVLKKRSELEDICRRAHMECDENVSEEKISALIDSGMIDAADLLSNMEDQIGKAKEEAFYRKEIMDKIERWIAACEEESWLEDYSKDENRYSASRGAHLNLKRAERARATVNKLPALIESLKAKARSWEEERGAPFFYDGVSLLAMLEEYNHLRREKEEEKRRMRDHKRIQEQLITEQEVLFGSRPSPIKPNSIKKTAGLGARTTNGAAGGTTPANRRLSMGGGGGGGRNGRLATTPAPKLEDNNAGAHPLSFQPDRKPLTPLVYQQQQASTRIINSADCFASPVKPTSLSLGAKHSNTGIANNTSYTNKSNSSTTLYKKCEPQEEVVITPVASKQADQGSLRSGGSLLVPEIGSVLLPHNAPGIVPSRLPQQEMEYSFEERRLLCLAR